MGCEHRSVVLTSMLRPTRPSSLLVKEGYYSQVKRVLRNGWWKCQHMGSRRAYTGEQKHRTKCEGVCWRQGGRDLSNYDPEIMELLRKERPESLSLGTRMSQWAYGGGGGEITQSLFRGRAQSSRRQLVEHTNLNFRWTIEGNNYMDTVPSTGRREWCAVRTVSNFHWA